MQTYGDELTPLCAQMLFSDQSLVDQIHTSARFKQKN